MKVELTKTQIRLLIEILGNATEDPGTLISIVRTVKRCKAAIDIENNLRDNVGYPARVYDDYNNITHHKTQNP